MNLANGCWTENVLLHELGHVLGLMHEHQRPDSFYYVKINLENIAIENQHAFSQNGKPTITTLSSYALFQNIMGKNTISDSDRRVVKAHYDVMKTDQYAGFSESYYRNRYTDVAAAIGRGQYSSGRDHYIRMGCREGRNPNMDFNELTYRRQNPDVANALTSGAFEGCGFLHFSLHGRVEGRRAAYAQ